MVEFFPVGTQKMWFVRLVVGFCFGDFAGSQIFWRTLVYIEVLLDV